MHSIGSVGKPREAVLALNGALRSIEEKSAGYSVSDVEGEDDYGRDTEEADHDALLEQLNAILECYTLGELQSLGLS